MEYRIDKVAKMANISVRTLRYYDEIDLLKPLKTDHNGKRIYGDNEIIRLFTILTLRAAQFKLHEISVYLSDPLNYPLANVEEKLDRLTKERDELDSIIDKLKIVVEQLKVDTKKDTKSIKSIAPNVTETAITEQKFKLDKKDFKSKNHYNLEHNPLNIFSSLIYQNISPEALKEYSYLVKTFFLCTVHAPKENDYKSDFSQEYCKIHINIIKALNYPYDKNSILQRCEAYVNDFDMIYLFNSIGMGSSALLLEATKYYFEQNECCD